MSQEEKKAPGVHELLCSYSGDGPESSSPGGTLTIKVDVGDLVQSEEEAEELDRLLADFADKIRKSFDFDSVQTPKQLEALAKWCDEEMARQ